MSEARAIKIAVTALGGQGGGVLAEWIGKLGEANGYIAQMTSVPGVAQRTGATVYYIELFSRKAAEAAGKAPVLALMPAPGDVDIVIAAELMEAGRAMARGFVSKATTFIASSHRDFAISEKIAMGDGRRNGDAIMEAARKAAKIFIAADLAEAAAETGTVISAVLFGALAGSGALPIERARFEEEIKRMGRAVEGNLRGFDLGFKIAEGQAPSSAAVETARTTGAPAPEVAPLIDKMRNELPAAVHYYVGEGLKRVVDYQNAAYANLYLDRLEKAFAVDRAEGGERHDWRLTRECAKHLALWMTYEDSIRVADLKTRAARFERFRDDVRAEKDQIVIVNEYLHPRVEEFCDILPDAVARAILNTSMLSKIVAALLGEGRRVPTTKLRGFLPLYILASLRFMRRSSYRFRLEQARIDNWLAAITREAPGDYELACEVARLPRLIKGYGETHERGFGNYSKVITALDDVKRTAQPAAALAKLHEAALEDDEGARLRAALSEISGDTRTAA